jgi:GTP pyrophosphokinase
MLEKEGRKVGVNVAKAQKEGRLDEVAKEFSFQGADDLLSSVGYARVTPRQVLHKLMPKPEAEKPETPSEEERAERESHEKAKAAEKVQISGVDDVLVRFAKCCNPVPGDPIIGYISRGRGVTVHTSDCPNVSGMEPERLLNISWEGEQDRPYPAKIKVVCKNRRGLLHRITGIMSDNGVNIDSGSFFSNVEGNTEIMLTVEVRDSGHLYEVIEHVSGLDDVIEVTRQTMAQEAEA